MYFVLFFKLGRFRDEFRLSFNDDNWPRKYEIHSIMKENGWVYLTDLIHISAFKKICSVSKICQNFLTLVFREFAERSGKHLEFQKNGIAVRRKCIHKKAKVRLNFIK